MGSTVSKAPEIDPSCPSCAALSERLDALERATAELASKQSQVIEEQARVIEEQAHVIEKQAAEIERLKNRKPKTSRTSSKPPSSDAPWKRDRPKRKGSGKKRGGQPGHAPKQREPAPPEDVDEVHTVVPDICGGCSAPLSGTDPNPLRHQVIDIPPFDPRIIEYQLHGLPCDECGTVTRAKLPEGVHQSAFGPNLTALVCLLIAEYRMSRRLVQRFIEDEYKISISLGAISNMERRMAEGLAEAHAEAMASVAESPRKYVDETPWRESNKLAWAWTAVGEKATVFVIRDTRGSVVAKELIGEELSGVVVADRFSGYSFIDLAQRQVCLAHLIRDFRQMAEGEQDLRWIGEKLLSLTDALFRLWHMHREGELDRPTLIRWTRPIRERVHRLLDEGARSRGYDTPSKCRGIVKTFEAMWTFVFEDGVEPTNNAAERALRPLVIQRKTSHGSQSERGSRFIERTHTAAETMRRAGQSVREFIGGIARSVLNGAAAPKLLS